MGKIVPRKARASSLDSLAERFLLYAQVELGFASQSLVKYRDCLRQICLMLEDKPLSLCNRDDVLVLKSQMLAKAHSVSRQVSILSTLKRFLQFCQGEGISVALEPQSIKIPRPPRRDVAYLTVDEVQRFIEAIKLQTPAGRASKRGIRFRALVEVLLGSAMRIGEVLSLDRDRVDFENREARIIGKGTRNA